MTHQVRLDNLTKFIPGSVKGTAPNIPITGITLDSRKVQLGNLFVALLGENTDGHRYIPQAIERGAAAVVGSKPQEALPVPFILVQDSWQALAYLSAAFYDFPARKLTVIGVTGTDGKTTTANLIFQILLAAGFRPGMISTVNAVIGDEILDTGFHVTTPEANYVQQYLAEMVAAGLTHVVLEATSHGLAQHRVTGCEFDVGVVTNITHEHLDYHGTYEAYRDAKAQLITNLAQTSPKSNGIEGLAVLNRDDISYSYLSKLVEPPVRQISYGLEPSAAFRAENIISNVDGLSFIALGEGIRGLFTSNLKGEYNIPNCLAAIAATTYGLNIGVEAAQAGIAALKYLPGRMEQVDLGQDFIAMVDFAHTPNALKRALLSAREILRENDIINTQGSSGRVIAIFGSAGLRDRAKRMMMAENSAELADITVLTAEDPRTESLEVILNEMSVGVEAKGGIEGQTYFKVPDRGEAIRFGISVARPGDVVIALGKGHEQSMCFGETEYSWDDRKAMRAALSEYLRIPGPDMPFLPTQGKDVRFT